MLAEAIAVAHAERGHAAVRIGLAGAHTRDALITRAAGALDVPLGGALVADAEARLAQTITARKPLILVDGWEGLAGRGDAVLARWADAGARLLVTSQVLPRIDGVVRIAIGPLEPAAALALLEARASAGRPVRALGPADAPALAALARRVDHLPLALELVAARLAVLSPEELLARTRLHDPITWAIELCDPGERATLALLAAYPAGLTVAAAEEILPAGRRAPLEQVQALRDRSLLHAWVPAPAAPARIAPFEALRAKIEAPPAARLAGADARLVARAERLARTAFAAADGGVALAALADERPNLEAVIERATAALAARALLALEPVLVTRAPPDQHAALCARVGGTPALRTRVLLSTGAAERAHGRPDAARRAYERALAAGRKSRDRAAIATARAMLGVLDVERGDAAGANRHLAAADALARAIPDLHTEGLVASHLAALRAIEGRPRDAAEAARRAIARFDAVGDARLALVARLQLGSLLNEDGALDEARPLLEDAHARADVLGDDRVRGRIACELALVEQEAGRVAASLAWHDRAVATLARSGPRRWEGIARGYRAGFRLEHGDPRTAATEAGSAVELLEAIGDVRNAGFFRAVRGAALAVDGRGAEAEGALGRSREELGAQGDPRRIAAGRVLEGVLGGRAVSGSVKSEAARSNDVRFALRVVRGLARAVVIEARARTVRVGGDVVSLAKYPTLWRLVDLLAARRRETPGVVVAREALLAAGWPRERILPAAAANRLHVALSTLRRLGLRDVIERVDEGWRMSPALVVRFSAIKATGSRPRGDLASKEDGR